MSHNAFVNSTSATINKAAIVAGTPGVASAARWFWWIAGLSLVNTALIHSGSETSFVVGLGFTLMADLIFNAIKPVAFAVDALAIGFFVLMGWLSLRGHFWAFMVGALIYAADALIYLKFGDMMPVGFHAFALFFIVRGAFALRSAITAAEIAAMDTPVSSAESVERETPPAI